MLSNALAFQIVQARPEDASALTEIALAAKRWWGYPPEWMAEWQAALTIGPDFISQSDTFKAVASGRILGFFSLIQQNDHLFLDPLWVWPEAMGKGVGGALFQRAAEVARAAGWPALEIASDPHAAGFYARMGAVRIRDHVERQGTITRCLPVFCYSL